MNTLFSSLLDLDTQALVSARGLVGPDYALLIQFSGELIVLTGAFLLIFLWIYGAYKRDNVYKYIALSIFFTIVFTFLVYVVINAGVPQWRASPQTVVGGIAPLIPHPLDNSFPSGHALFSGAFLVALSCYFRRPWLIFSIGCIALITLVSRVIGGVHYPGDIIGGLFFGSLGALVVRPLVDYIVAKVGAFCMRIASWIGL